MPPCLLFLFLFLFPLLSHPFHIHHPFTHPNHHTPTSLRSSEVPRSPFNWASETRDTQNDDLKSPSSLPLGPQARLLAPRLHSTNIYLVGLMGSGKSTVGELLARYLQSYTFVDTDVVCKSTIKTDSMDKVFEKMGGEEGFRDLER